MPIADLAFDRATFLSDVQAEFEPPEGATDAEWAITESDTGLITISVMLRVSGRRVGAVGMMNLREMPAPDLGIMVSITARNLRSKVDQSIRFETH